MLRLYTFKSFENGIYRRDAVLETDSCVKYQLADIPLDDPSRPGPMTMAPISMVCSPERRCSPPTASGGDDTSRSPAIICRPALQ